MKTSVGRAVLFAVPIIVAVVLALFVISYFMSTLVGLPLSLDLPTAVRVAGGAIVLSGMGIGGWVLAHRGPTNVIVSTYITLTKLFRRTLVSESAGRTEPLIITGPQKYVRNPLYFGVVVMVFGWAILTSFTFVFIATVIILLWFTFVLIPFEERELYALFGEQWKKYSESTPMLFPFTKRKKPVAPGVL